MSYLESGFNNLLQKIPTTSAIKEVTEDSSAFSIPYLSGSAVAGGVTRSQNGKVRIDWTNGQILLDNGDAYYRLTEKGMWLGAQDFDDAPFSVDMEGAMNVKSATFKTDDDTTIIDGTGLVSTANFTSGAVNGTSSDNTISNLTWVDMDEMELTVTLTRTVKVLFGFTGEFYTPVYGHGDAWVIYVGLDIGGTVYPNATYGWGPVAGKNSSGSGDDYGTTTQGRTQTHLVSLGSGTHTCKIRWMSDTGAANKNTYVGSNRHFWYIALGS